jgi:NAD(P)H-dependent flavin oxidoreductase YrpB (nitropropane dioxygenase family)
MILIGHPWIKSPEFCRVFSLEDIQKSRADQVVLLEPLVDSHMLAQYCQENGIAYAVVANTLDEAIYANALGAAYIICDEDTALMIQPVAQEYLFDTRVLVLIHSEKEISKIARGGIDGVIFAEAIC